MKMRDQIRLLEKQNQELRNKLADAIGMAGNWERDQFSNDVWRLCEFCLPLTESLAYSGMQKDQSPQADIKKKLVREIIDRLNILLNPKTEQDLELQKQLLAEEGGD